jgi:hypothetical protein
MPIIAGIAQGRETQESPDFERSHIIELEVSVQEVRPSGRTNREKWKRPLGPEASRAEAHEFEGLNVGAKAPTS